jgi:thiosulfate dehydrogenase (quinone) large subunit
MSRAHGRANASPLAGLAADWRSQSPTLRILRAFLGGTFLYAGVQKFADPTFFRAGDPGSIQTQLREFAQTSPLRPLLNALGHMPILVGASVALLEIAIGLATLLGVAPVTAAVAGLVLNVVLWLSATWHVHPYFLGSDSIYAVAWGAYLVGVALPNRQPTASRAGLRRAGRSGHIPDESRRNFLRGTAVAVGTLLIGAVARTAAGSRAVRASESLPGAAVGATTTPPSRHAHRSRQSPPSGTPIATLDSIPVGGAMGFQDPSVGPAILVRTASSDVAAFSRVCTHAGCLVGYDQASELIVCPCHGAEFDPKQRAAVVAGPAPTPLAPIPVAIDRTMGQVLRQD